MDNGKWFVVVNPESANGRTREQWPGFQKHLEAAGWHVDYEWTNEQGHATKLVQKAFMAGYRKIIGVGGDGTINEIINGIMNLGQEGSQVELDILSHGTGGDFSRSLKIPRGIEGVLQVLRCGKKRWVDVGSVEFLGKQDQLKRYFLNVADAGLGGETVARVNRQNKFWGGKLSFLLGSIQSILAYHNKVMSCRIDGELVVQGRMNSIMVANGRYIGGGMQIAPLAEIDDGMFDIVVLGDFNTAQLLFHLPKIYRGTHLKVPGVRYYRGRTVLIESHEDVLIDIDGEQQGLLPARYTNHPKALCIWC